LIADVDNRKFIEEFLFFPNRSGADVTCLSTSATVRMVAAAPFREAANTPFEAACQRPTDYREKALPIANRQGRILPQQSASRLRLLYRFPDRDSQFSVQTFIVFMPVSASVRVLKTPLSTIVVVVVGFLSTMVHFLVVASLTT
jgi:hypothetical protein